MGRCSPTNTTTPSSARGSGSGGWGEPSYHPRKLKATAAIEEPAYILTPNARSRCLGSGAFPNYNRARTQTEHRKIKSIYTECNESTILKFNPRTRPNTNRRTFPARKAKSNSTKWTKLMYRGSYRKIWQTNRTLKILHLWRLWDRAINRYFQQIM